MKRLLMILLIVPVLTGCFLFKKSIKDKEKTNTTVENKNVVDSSAFWKERYHDLLFISNEEKSQLSSALEFQSGNQEILVDAFSRVKALLDAAGYKSDSLDNKIRKIFDSLKNSPCKNSLEIDNKGNLKATGLKSANLEFLQLKSQIAELIDEREREISKRLYVEDQLKLEQSTKTVVKKSKPMAGFFILVALIFYVLGSVYPAKKLWAQTKVLFKLLITKNPTT